MADLWSKNHPRRFWCLEPDPPDELWQKAIHLAAPVLELPWAAVDVDTILALTLGEGQFGADHYKLSLSKRTYYNLKPLLPRSLINLLKRENARSACSNFLLGWPVEDRYVRFQWEIIRQLLILTGESQWNFRHFWPGGKRFALVLTHDVETSSGFANIRQIADQEEKLGFRSSFNLVPELYELDRQLIEELRDRGFEIGLHGLKHDGKLFNSQTNFMQRAARINHYMEEFNAHGFRSPLMHRHPEWMQVLRIEYDLSFFDSDPYEPLPGGCMSIWPFAIGHFIELPYTLPQDCTIRTVLNESTPHIWLEKLKFLEKNSGLALLLTHPDYLLDTTIRDIYFNFLEIIAENDNYWHALPNEVARWWQTRSDSRHEINSPNISSNIVFQEDNHIKIYQHAKPYSFIEN